MPQEYAKVYISLPRPFLEEVDKTAEKEHLSRSALIREALKVYMEVRTRTAFPRFLRMADELRTSFEGLAEEDLEQRIDRAVAHARARA